LFAHYNFKYDDFKFLSFSIKNTPHFSSQFNCKINIILILDFQCFNSLYFKISDQSPNFMNLSGVSNAQKPVSIERRLNLETLNTLSGTTHIWAAATQII